MPSDISDEKKQLVWDFIEMTASPKYQQRFAEWAKTPAPRPGVDYTQLMADNPSFKVLAKAAEDAAAAGTDRLPKGLELENNEVVKIFHKVAQQMILQDLDPAEAAKRLQAGSLAHQGLNLPPIGRPQQRPARQQQDPS